MPITFLRTCNSNNNKHAHFKDYYDKIIRYPNFKSKSHPGRFDSNENATCDDGRMNTFYIPTYLWYSINTTYIFILGEIYVVRSAAVNNKNEFV